MHLGRTTLLAGLAGGSLLTAEAAPEVPAPFSHRRHLALPGLTCAMCHATITASTSSADDNRPKAEVCAQCHQGTRGSPGRAFAEGARPHPAAVRLFRFDHQRHLALGDVGLEGVTPAGHVHVHVHGAPGRPRAIVSRRTGPSGPRLEAHVTGLRVHVVQVLLHDLVEGAHRVVDLSAGLQHAAQEVAGAHLVRRLQGHVGGGA